MKARFPKNTFNSVSLAIIGAAIIIMVAGIIYYVQQDKQKEAIEMQTSKTNQLILDVKTLSEDNKKLNEQNRNYAYCNAVLLAKYTQDQQPIVIDDLSKCVFSSFPRGSGPNQDTQSNAEKFLKPQATENSISNNTSKTTPSSEPERTVQPNQPTTEVQSPNQLLSIPDLLNINVPCANLLQLVKTCQ